MSRTLSMNSESGSLSQRSRRPVGGGVRLAFQSIAGYRDGVHRVTPRGTEEGNAVATSSRSQRDLRSATYLGIAPPFGAEQHDAGAQRQGQRRLETASPFQQPLSFGGDKSQGREPATESHAVPPAWIRCRKSCFL
jgi:hypothetical protein